MLLAFDNLLQNDNSLFPMEQVYDAVNCPINRLFNNFFHFGNELEPSEFVVSYYLKSVCM